MARDEGDSRISEHKPAEHRGAEHREAVSTRASRLGPQLLNRTMLTTAALIGVAALIEPELLIGMALGAGAAMVSSWLPDVVGGTVRPIVKTAIKAGYAAASAMREIASEASESFQDMVAETQHERGPAS